MGVIQLLPTRAVLGALLLAAPLHAAGDLLAVDAEGRPLPGVQLELVMTQPGVYGAAGPRRVLTTGEDGRVDAPAGDLAPLDVKVAPGQGWGVSFVHGPRITDETQAEDLMGAKPRVWTLEGTTTVVLDRTGTLVVEVVNASPEDVFHVTLVDERPEIFSHRPQRETRTFRGARGELDLPAGRGTLYVCEEGSLGAAALAGTPQGGAAPYLVSVHPGARTHVELRMVDGPFTSILAPFEQIPFETLEALSPDGVSVVGSFEFAASPLRIPTRIAIAMGTSYDGEGHLTARFPKHFVRAAGIPLVRPEPERPLGAPERETAPPPLDLTIAVDLGGKIRLPEVESGWVMFATSAAMLRGGMTGGLQTRFTNEPTSGVLELPDRADPRVPRRGQVLEPLPPVPTWTAHLALVDAAGAAAPHREILVALDDGTLARGITDARGRLEVRGVRGGEPIACPLGAVGTQASLEEGAGTEAEPARLVLPAPGSPFEGTWLAREEGAPVVGQVVALLPLEAADMDKRARFMTRAFPIAITDREGRFRIDGVPAGRYRVHAGRGAAGEIALGTGDEPARAGLTGTDEDLALRVEGR